MAKIKKSKADSKIRYQNQPNGNQRCGLCTMFRSPDECTAVAGTIKANGWCKIFYRKRDGKPRDAA